MALDGVRLRSLSDSIGRSYPGLACISIASVLGDSS